MPRLHSYRNQSIDLLCKSINWFLYEGNTGTNGLSWISVVAFEENTLKSSKLRETATRGVFYRSNRSVVSCEKGVLINFAKFTGKHLCQGLFLSNFTKKRLWQRCFPVNFAKFLRTTFSQNTTWRLLLHFKTSS